MTTATVSTRPPAYYTGTLRYDFQIASARKHAGKVLNVGCNEDAIGLRRMFGDRMVNCDMEGWDHHMDRPNVVDRIFDCLEVPWPFEDDYADLVIFGDILEHFPKEQSIRALTEAQRVATHVCVTVPEDTRIDEAIELTKWKDGDYNLHTTLVTREVLEDLLKQSGWELDWLVGGLWGIGAEWGPDGINGWCAHAHRIVTR